MRWLLLLAIVLPLPALAAGPMVLDSPDLRQLSGPRVTGGSDGITCLPVPGVGLRCSDGRVSTTVRASTVPCETAAGAWTHTAAGTACVSVRGLESWGANTNLVGTGTNPVWSGFWIGENGATPTAIADGVRVTATTQSASGFSDGTFDVGVDEPHTIAAIVRPGSTSLVRFWLDAAAASCDVTLTGTDWQQASCSKTLLAGAAGRRKIYHQSASPVGSYFDVQAVWEVKALLPGRPCWQASGAAPFTCAGDVTTISTSGWPTTEGEVCVTATVEAGATRMLLDSTADLALYVSSIGALNLLDRTNGAPGSLNGGAVTAGVPHKFCVGRRDGATSITVDGAVVASKATAFPLRWAASAMVGSDKANGSQINGSISRLSWSTR